MQKISGKSHKHRPEPTNDTKWKNKQTNEDSTYFSVKENQSNQIPRLQEGDRSARHDPLNTTKRQRTGQPLKNNAPISSHKATKKQRHNYRLRAVNNENYRGCQSILLVPNRHPWFKSFKNTKWSLSSHRGSLNQSVKHYRKSCKLQSNLSKRRPVLSNHLFLKAAHQVP